MDIVANFSSLYGYLDGSFAKIYSIIENNLVDGFIGKLTYHYWGKVLKDSHWSRK